MWQLMESCSKRLRVSAISQVALYGSLASSEKLQLPLILQEVPGTMTVLCSPHGYEKMLDLQGVCCSFGLPYNHLIF